jgi:protein-tyrosine phosphatase
MVQSVLMVCMGNICRSPIAEHVFRAKAEQAGLQLTVASAGTGGWHAGEPADYRAVAVLNDYGYTSEHRAQQFRASWFEDYDLILVMDTDNLHGVLQHATKDDHRTKVKLFRAFDSTAPKNAEVPDPYYGNEDGFVTVLKMIERASDGLVQHILETSE